MADDGESDMLKRKELAEFEQREWADLPNELLTLILSHVFLDDIDAFHGVCRTWQSIISPSVNPPITFPVVHSQWLISKCPHRMRCNFFHPVYSQPYSMDIPELSGAVLRFSKDGWLLMSRGDHSVFFFNPFAEAKINLPDLPVKYTFDSITFSSPPTSYNCLVFCISGFFEEHVTISTIRRGEESWHVYEFKNNLPIVPSPCNPVLHNGVFYCLGRDGNLGAFDPEENKWTVHANPQPPCDLGKQNFLMECDGDLISVFVGFIGKWVSVFRLDSVKMAWQKVTNLGDKMLLLSDSTSFSASKVIRGMENKIYFPRFHGECGVFHSLATGMYQTFGNAYSRKDLYGTRDQLHCCWIEPRADTYSERELNWLTE